MLPGGVGTPAGRALCPTQPLPGTAGPGKHLPHLRCPLRQGTGARCSRLRGGRWEDPRRDGEAGWDTATPPGSLSSPRGSEVPVSVTRGFAPADPASPQAPRGWQPARRGPSPGGAPPGGSSVLPDYSAARAVYLRMWGMWAEHGQGPGAGQQGGNQGGLETAPPGQAGGRAREPQEGGPEPASLGPLGETGRNPQAGHAGVRDPTGTPRHSGSGDQAASPQLIPSLLRDQAPLQLFSGAPATRQQGHRGLLGRAGSVTQAPAAWPPAPCVLGVEPAVGGTGETS